MAWKMRGSVKVLVIGIVNSMMFLLAFNAFFAFAQTYEILSIGAVHVEDDTVYVTPVYGTDVLEDTVNGILRFKVVEHPLGYQQLLGASTNISDISKPIQQLPILKTLNAGDIVEIDYKDCNYTQKSIEQIPLTDNYLILYAGQANACQINGNTIPELTSNITVATLLLVSLCLIIWKKLKRDNSVGYA
jgi:hypothetical protein